MKSLTFSLPFLPPSLNVYRNDHWRKQRGEEKTWKDHIAVKWAEMGRPKLKTVRIGMVFSFPDRRTRDLDNYLATGSKLVGDAVKGLFIPDDSPEHLTAWSFRFEFGKEARTTIIIEETDRNTDGGFSGEQATFWEDSPAQSKKRTAGEQVLSGRLSGGQTTEVVSAIGRPTCTLYETCNTPLCPLEGSSLNGIWYPDEDICRSRVHGNLSWMKAQRKLSRVAAGGYFTVEMLNRLVVIRKGIAGLDPNLPEEPQLRSWFQKRTEKQDTPSEAKADRTRHLKKYRFQKQDVQEG
jgi:Holliday junction resolvase RusA-like endonuclease